MCNEIKQNIRFLILVDDWITTNPLIGKLLFLRENYAAAIW